ncbi:G-alpha-domain-containing protein [Lentinula edodes]|uniref:G-alpha-domain-containing protein n=1 Tax=Lentinula edodes TaxID=5353 RepID=A0A1Q3E6V5_LENED|nr:G-alpha-domain-containing protein [Lentinula edodes]
MFWDNEEVAGASSVATLPDDPFDEFLKPPPGETHEQRITRLTREEEASKISMAIDASIKAERQLRKKMRIVRLLLLGQSESGKSVTLRQFQRLYTPTAFREERILWRGVIQLNIVRRKIRLEEYPGFFLNDLERVTSLKYIPTDDDVLKARLKTVGVSEYRFQMEVSTGRETGTDWRIVDVGGSRSQRQTWIPFFDNVDAIIFLAPISGFDQVLSEDRTVNRLEDSVLLWKTVCSNKLLANVDLVLFLNKCDILETKLKAGVRLAKYVKSFGDRANNLETVSKYFRSKFSAIHREYSPNPRKFYAFCTSVTDTATTAGIIASVRDMVIRQHLKQSKLM